MAKTAKFDRQNVINKATQLYWQKGFHATSMRNLQDVIDMRPGSIYAAFGSKDELFKEVLKNYTDMGIDKLTQFRQADTSPLNALKAFVKYQVLDTLTDAPNAMCMLAKTVSELNDEHTELLEHAKDALRRIEQEFAHVIKQAQRLSEIDSQKDPQRLASHVQIQITGLRTYAKVNGADEVIAGMIDDMFIHYPF